MAEVHRKSLVLRDVLVAREVVAVLERFVGSPADARTPALSYPRHLSTWTTSPETDSQPRHDCAVSNGVNHPARRAGRPGGPAGVPVRIPARSAGRTIPFGMAPAVGVVAPAWCVGPLAVKRTGRQGQRLLQRHSQALARRSQPTGSLTRLPVQVWPGTRGEAAMRMPRASIRGM
jgi:hypothetical protein